MSAVELLQLNLQSLVKANAKESVSFAHSLEINLEELLSKPANCRKELSTFLQKFELSLPSIMVPNFQPIQLAQFKKNNDESVSNKLLDNLKTIGHYYREKQIIDANTNVEFIDYRHLTNMQDLLTQVYKDLNFDSYRKRFESADNKAMYYVLKDLIQDIENLYGLKIFFTDKEKSNFNFDGVYFNKPIATAYVDAHSSYYTKAIFTMFHELYHFLQDDGETFTFDLFDMGMFTSEQRTEDIRANRFASEFLLFNSQDDLQILMKHFNRENLKSFLKKYSVSKEALSFFTKDDNIKKISTGRLPQAFFPYAKTSIKELLSWQYENTYISLRKQTELLASIG